MTHRLIAFGGALAVIVGCHDGPTAPASDMTVEAQRLPAPVLTTMHALLGDPLVLAVVAQADRTNTTNAVQRTMQEVMTRVTLGAPQAIAGAITDAQWMLSDAGDGGTIHKGALSLTLDAVQAVLDEALNTDSTGVSDGTPSVQLTKRSP